MENDDEYFWQYLFPSTLGEALDKLSTLPEPRILAELYMKYTSSELSYALIILNILQEAGKKGIRLDNAICDLLLTHNKE